MVDWDGDTTYTATVKRFDAKADLALLEIANPSPEQDIRVVHRQGG
ncbi:MAG: hypothetical protein ACYC9Q_12325 [Bacillota bacterium]